MRKLDFVPNQFQRHVDRLALVVMRQFAVEFQWTPKGFAGSRVKLVVDRGDRAKLSESCYCIAWAPLAHFIGGPPAVGDRMTENPGDVNATELQISDIRQQENGIVHLLLVLAKSSAL